MWATPAAVGVSIGVRVVQVLVGNPAEQPVSSEQFAGVVHKDVISIGGLTGTSRVLCFGFRSAVGGSGGRQLGVLFLADAQGQVARVVGAQRRAVALGGVSAHADQLRQDGGRDALKEVGKRAGACGRGGDA